jgi:NAD(P)-dependent dehydrogenase (short-subunit alcohol dehydrogenase family)
MIEGTHGELAGRIAIVTGAGSGIGRATSLLFAREGATVIAADVTDGAQETADHGDKQRSALGDQAGRILAMRCDAGNEADIANLVAKTQADHGAVNIFYANAGISGGWDGLFDQTAEDWAEILRINLIGPFLAMKYAGKAMADAGKGGSIIATASVAGLKSGAGGPAYTASKAGVINLVRISAQQLTGSGVRVNAICPGLIETGMTAQIYEKVRAVGREGYIGQLNPLKRGGQPEEIAQAALFLASDRSSYVNGHALVVDGGLTSSFPYSRQEFGKTAS